MKYVVVFIRNDIVVLLVDYRNCYLNYWLGNVYLYFEGQLLSSCFFKVLLCANLLI